MAKTISLLQGCILHFFVAALLGLNLIPGIYRISALSFAETHVHLPNEREYGWPFLIYPAYVKTGDPQYAVRYEVSSSTLVADALFAVLLTFIFFRLLLRMNRPYSVGNTKSLP